MCAKIGFDTAANELFKVGCAARYQLYLYPLSGTQEARHTKFLTELLHELVRRNFLLKSGACEAHGDQRRRATAHLTKRHADVIEDAIWQIHQ